MINVNQQALLELLKASLFGEKTYFPEDVDWDAVLQEAKDQAVVALAAPAVPEAEANKWQIHISQNKMRFFQILDEQTKLVQLFSDADIPMVILKGCAAALYYPVPMNRTMGDIDFIVIPERFDEARQMMEEHGYEYVYDLDNDRDYSYHKRNTIFEIHHHYSDKDWNIEPLILEGLSCSGSRELYGARFPVLPAEINGIVLLDHVRHHLDGGIGIRQVIDWMMFAHTYLDDETWKTRFAPVARKAGLETMAIIMTKMCIMWLGLPDSAEWYKNADEKVARELLETVFNFGNFGRKNHHVNKPGESIALRSRKGNLFQFLQRTGLEQWKACQKYQILRPFAWLYQSFRYLGMGFASVFRGDNIYKDYMVGKKRANFYKRLGIDKQVVGRKR